MIVTDSIELFPNSVVTDMIKDIENVPDFRKQYLSHCDINAYLDSLQAKYPHLVQVKIIGYTFEKRVLKSIHISFKAESDLNETKSEIKKVKSSSSLNSTKSVRPISSFSSLIKPKNESTLNRTKHVILIDAGMHAREWCTISSALYCASQLTENFDAHKDLLNAFDFVIVPIVNADGYEYSRTFKKMWRKSRRPLLYSTCVGVDCNRNFSVGWATACSRTASYTFRGEKPFSEPETRIIKHLMHSLKPKFYLTLHSFSKSIMFPYAFTSCLPKNWLDLNNLAKAGYLAIQKATGTKFRTGNVASLVKNATNCGGGSVDYAHKTAGIPFVIVMELSGGSFQPPAKQIYNIVYESWIGIQAMCSYIKNKT